MFILNRLKEGILAILPIYLIILILYFTPFLTLTNYELLVFTACSALAAVGISLFNLGAESAMTPMGKAVGSGLTKKGNLMLLIIISFLLGLMLTVAEPDLQVLAKQVSTLISPLFFTLIVGIGVGLFIVIAILRMIFKVSLSSILMFMYALTFGLAILLVYVGNGNLLPLIMDSGGVTTGPITVPFLMALCIGISQIIAKKSEKDMNFGLMGLCSIGAIVVVLFVGLFLDSNLSYKVGDYSLNPNFFNTYLNNLFDSFKEVTIVLILISIFFLICNYLFLHISKNRLIKMGIGMIYTLLGLSLFLSSVSTGFMPIGYLIGEQLASYGNTIILTFCFIVGAATVLAEPAIHVLNTQISEVTGGIVKKHVMLIGLMIGVALSLVLSIIRIIYHFDIMYYLVPGFLICLLLSFFVPKVYVAIAFDSGGVAAGAMTSSFMLPLAIGVCVVLQGESQVLTDAFGIVAMVALTPIMVIELIGLIAIIRDKLIMKKQVSNMILEEDEVIIKF